MAERQAVRWVVCAVLGIAVLILVGFNALKPDKGDAVYERCAKTVRSMGVYESHPEFTYRVGLCVQGSTSER